MSEETLFELALKTPAAERAALLERACEGQPELRARVDRLLAAHEAGGVDLDKPPELPPTSHHQPSSDDRVDQEVGRYRLLQKLGEGGMGAVWVAEQTHPVKRRVALKLIKAGMDSARIVARFEAERQALAMMDHPHIAKVLDAGTTPDGRPYFAMELVKGVPITKYCDEVQATLKERLELFVQVCGAVQHAHQKGIIHRDLKPTNILVAMHDGVAAPKVIDFGVAKALHAKLADRTLYTEIGQVIGTLEYMAPEQAELSAMDIDTRADVYALGVLLYELLAGSTPITRARLQQAGFAEILRIIKEEEPPRPSTRLSASNESLPSLAAERRIEPRKLAKALAGELDWIALKALEKNRARRYETANALAADVRRYLSDEPVEARPPSRAYRMQKFYRRNRGLVVGTALVFLTLVGGIFGTSLGFARAKLAEADAKEKRDEAVEERKKADEERTKTNAALAAEARQRATAERNLVGGLLRPIGFSTDDTVAAEMKSLSDWSAIEDTRLKLLGLETAFDRPEVAFRVARRSERVLQAVVGLSPTRRAAAIELMSAKQRDRSADFRVRLAACWLALELGSNDLPALNEWVEHCTAMPMHHGEEILEYVQASASRADPKQRSVIERSSFDSLISVLEKGNDWHALQAAAIGLEKMAPRLDTPQGGRAFLALVGVLDKDADAMVLRATGKGLVALEPRLNAPQLARCFEALVAALHKITRGDAMSSAATGLTALAPRVDRSQAERAFDALLVVLGKTTDREALSAAGAGVAALAPYIAAEQAERGFDELLAVLGKTTDREALSAAVSGLDQLHTRLNLTHTQRALDGLRSVLAKSTDASVRLAVAPFLTRSTMRLSDGQFRRRYEDLIARLIDSEASDAMCAACIELYSMPGERIDSSMARIGFEASIKAIGKTIDESTLHFVGEYMVKLAPRLEDDLVPSFFNRLTAFLKPNADSDVVDAAGEGLTALARRLDDAQSQKAFDLFIAVLENSTDYMTLYTATRVVEVLATRTAAAKAEHSFQRLIAVLATIRQWSSAEALGAGLVTLAGKLDATGVERGFDALVAVLGRTSDNNALRAAADGLTALAPRVQTVRAARGFDALVVVLAKTTDRNASIAAGSALMALGPALDLSHSDRSFEKLHEFWRNSDDSDKLSTLAVGMTAIASKISSPYASRAFQLFLAQLNSRSESYSRSTIINAITAFVPRVDVECIAKGLDALVAIESDLNDDEETLKAVRHGLRIVQSHIQPSSLKHDAISRAVRRLLDRCGQPDGIADMSWSSHYACTDGIRELTRTHSDARDIAILLSHPACVGESRRVLLSRFEELTIHKDKPLPQPRAFYTVHDAAAWIEKNWPDFDLEKSCPYEWN